MTVRISPGELLGLDRDGAQHAVIDVREEGAFVGAHLLKASTIPLRQLETVLPSRVPVRSCTVVLCDEDGTLDALTAAARLQSWGYTDVRVLNAGIAGWKLAGQPLYSGMHTPSKAFGEAVELGLHTPSIPPAELARRQQAGEPLVLIDCRPHDEYLKASLPGSINIPGVELFYRFSSVVTDPQMPVVVHCAGRTRSIIGAQSLRDAGVPNPVCSLENGTMGWLLAGHQTVQPGIPPAGFDAPPQGVEAALALAERLRAQHAIALVDAAQVEAWCAPDAVQTTYVVDVRTAEEYRAGHPARAMHAPGGQLLQATDKYLVVQNARVVVADDNGARATMAAAWLRRLGWKEVYVWPFGRETLLLACGPEPRRYYAAANLRVSEIGAARLAALSGEGAVEILDLDTSLEYEKAHLPGARFAKRRSLATALAGLPAGRPVVLTSSDGVIARLAAAECGMPDRVSVLEGGKAAWIAQGRPVASGAESMLETPNDVWRRPVEAPGDPVQNMNQYLSWEIGLVEQIRKDKTVRFAL